MRKIRKRILAVALAAVMLVHIPGTASYAEQAASDVETTLEKAASVEVTASAETEPEEDGSEGIPETAADDGNGLEPDAEKPEKEETAPSEGEGKDCGCVTLCTQDNINGDCPVCGAEGADLSACRGEEQNNVPDNGKEDGTDTAQCICGIVCTEDGINGDCPLCGAEGADLSVCEGTAYEGREKEEETTEVTELEEAETEDTNLCAHHKEHTQDCGFVPATEDSEGSPCTYECRVCPIEDLIAALPDEVTADNAEDVRARLDEILALYGGLTEEEQEQINLSRCYELQEALDEANTPMPLVTGDVILSETNMVKLTAEDCGVNCLGHTITEGTDTEGTEFMGVATILVESGSHNITFSNLNLTTANVGVMPGGRMNLTLTGENTIKSVSNKAGIYVPKDATLIIDGDGSLDVSGGLSGAGIGGTYYVPDGSSTLGDTSCGEVIINSGTITATGGEAAAGIGGGEGGNGGTVTINGGNVTAKAGGDGAYGVPGIGGGYDAKSDGSLTLSSADVLADTVLGSGGIYTINGDPTPDMIVVPEGLVYTGKPLNLNGKIYIDDTKTGTATYFERTFTVKASADGWVLQDLDEVVNAGTYTAIFEKDGKTISRDFTVAQSGTEFDGKLIVRNGETETTAFTVSDTITVIATPKATGQAPANGAMLAADLAVPTGGQMALYVGDTQVSRAVDAVDGSYTMEASAADVLKAAPAGADGKSTLIVKFVGNNNMANAEAQVQVTVTPNPLTAEMVALDTESVTYNGKEQKPTVTVSGLTEGEDYEVTFQGDFQNARNHTVTVTGKGIYAGTVAKTFTIGKATPTITWENDTVELTYTGQPAAVKPIVTLVNGETYNGKIIYNYGFGSLPDMPTNVMTYASVKASIPEQANYTAAESGWLHLTILPADQAAPAAPAATDENIKDTSITLTAIDGAEYSKDNGASWQGSPTFTGLTPNTKYTFCARMKEDQNHNASPASAGTDITTKKTMLNGAVVTVSGSFTYNGTAQTPEADQVTVTLNGTKIDSDQYTISATGNTNAGTATVTVTAKAEGNYSGSTSGKFMIDQATPTVKWDNASQKLTYTGQPAGITAPVVTLVNNESFNGTITYFNPEDGTVYHTLPAAVGTYKVKARIDAAGNYAAAESADTLTLTISYMAPPANILYNNGTKQNYYGREEVVISAQGYKVSESQDSGYADSFTIPVPGQTGTVKKTLYFSKDGGISDGVEITVNFDLTPPAGSITVGKGFWDSFLEKVSFGHYKAKEYVVTIKAEDAGGSGIGKTEYVIVEGESQYTDPAALEAEKPDWKEYTGKPTVPVSGQYAVYARLTDKAGNVTYISTDGILLDETPPAVDSLSVPESTVGTETAEFTFTVDEAADYYYVVLPEGAATPEKEDIMTAGAGGTAVPGSAASGRGEVTEEQITGGKAAVRVKVTGLIPGTAYKVHVTAVDKTVDLETGAPAGNVAEVETSSTFTMKKLDQAAPALSYKTDRTDKNNIKITIDPVKGAWYSFDGGQKWTDSNEQAGFDSSQTVTLAIQMKETATHNASPAQTVTVNLAKEDRDAPPAFTLKYDANGETDYTVTIPPTEGCEYSFDGEHWSDSNVKTGVKVGETVTGYKRYKETDQYNTSNAASASETMPEFTVKTPVVSPAGGSFAGSVSVTITCGTPGAEIYYTTDGSTPSSSSTRYTGAFTVTAPARVRAIAIKEGFQDSAVAEASYTKQSGGGSSGGDGNGSGGNGSGGGNGGNNSGPGTGGDTAPVTPVIPPAADEQTGPGTETEQAGPGNGNTSKPGSGNTGTPGNKTEQGNTPQDGREPFIKGEDGKIGWDVIRTEEEMAEDGDTIHIDMNGSTVVPGDIFDRLKGRDITITFDMGDGILWSVDGKSITTDKAGDIDFGLKTGVRAIPVDIVNNVTGERYSIQISLTYSGEFGFTAVLSIGLGKENAGYTASLYYYNKSTGELEFICKDTVAQDGTVSLSFTHASDYVIAIDTETTGGKEEEDSTSEEPGTDGSGSMADTEVKEEVWNYKWIIVIGAFVIAAGLGILLIYKKKKEEQQ